MPEKPTPTRSRSDTPSSSAAGARPLETRERDDARRRAEGRERMRAEGREPLRGMYTGVARPSVAARAFAALADNVRDYAIFLMNPHGIITFWGEGARLTKWWTKDQAEGAHLRMLYPDGGSDDGTAEQHLQMAAERGEYSGEGMRIRSDDSTFWAGVTLTALRDQNGALLGFAKVTRDLTAQRAAEAVLQNAAQSAEVARAAAVAANAAKSGFLATISHEIRTPVNAILGYHQLLELQIDGPLLPAQREHLRRASASGRHLLTLITEVLDFSRLDSGNAGLPEAQSFRIGDAVRGAIDLVMPQAESRYIVMRDAVSGYARGLAAWGEETSTRQILANLLSNAVKFTNARDGEPGRVTVSAGTAERPSPGAMLSGQGPWVYVRIEDTGIGIAPDRLESMFEPFVQADMSLTRQIGGTGLGLAISRRLARLMRGDVTAHSEPGVGSSFFLWLPAASAETLQTRGIPGSGPTGVEQGGDHDPEDDHDLAGAMPSTTTTADVGKLLLGDIERIIHAYVARLHNDPRVPGAKALDEALLQDHVATFLADLASTLTTMDVSAGLADESIRDGTAIQRVVGIRHGAQRARLGWTIDEVHREFEILREELTASVQRRANHPEGGLAGPRDRDVLRFTELVQQFVTRLEALSVAAHAEASAESESHARGGTQR